MKKTLVILLALVFVLGIAGTAFAANPFDVPPKHWAYEAVSKLAQDGIIDGYSDGAFRGDQGINRYEMAQIVAKAMTHASKADASNKVLIDKLAVEFESELRTLGARVSKLEDRTTKLEAKSNFKIESETLIQYQSDSPPAGKAKLQGNDQLSWRERLYLSAAVNENTTFDARLQTTIGKFGSSGVPGTGNTIEMDRGYFTTKNVLGFDKVMWGRQPLLFGQGGLYWRTGNHDGVTLFKKLDKSLDFQAGVYVANPQSDSPVQGESNEFQYAGLGYQVSPNLKINGSYYNNNQKLTQGSSLYNYGYDQSKGWDVSFANKIGAWTLIGEYVSTTLDNPVGAASNPKMYAFQITNGTNLPSYFYPVQRFIVDYKKPHTDAFALSYRSVEKGAVPNGDGFAFGKVGTSPLYKFNGNAVNGSAMDNLKGYFFTYENVIAKNIVLSIEYQDLKVKDSGASFDKAITSSLQMVF
ncbi:S-layer homology domain-containing protein [Pelosinus sp. sgz500959]|uniref:S-layer homology domain-containing protein n=1 Tax=Pelosinus sp. sgz500959 TaxID=3242472 RepID=UPI00366B05C9